MKQKMGMKIEKTKGAKTWKQRVKKIQKRLHG